MWSVPTLLLRYWQPAASAVIAGAIVYSFCHFVYTWRIERIENEHKAELVAQQERLVAECAKDKQITTEVSHDYQNQIADLRGQLAAVKRVRPSACIPVHVAKPTGGRDAATGNGQLSRPYAGVDSDDLFDFAFDAEQVGRQLDACQSFITRTWAAKSQ